MIAEGVLNFEETPIVTVKKNTVVCNSRDVADYFGKLHKNVLRDLDALMLKTEPQAMFSEIQLEGRTGFGKCHYRAFDMTRDGFTLLAMGFTGKKAQQFKLKYIAQFNAMEEELKRGMAPALPDFSSPAIAARAWAEQLAAESKAKLDAVKEPSLTVPRLPRAQRRTESEIAPTIRRGPALDCPAHKERDHPKAWP
ncbi:Rha family transcriptional regulator [Ensifer sp. ZNC0028]|uniref:Rha family transcriptional regulator n=1 Tax=Ensifer sp. ZNC0028 TaxID=1339236 RepID=UPI00068DCF5C|nr:Rha family transcriptional regulator [Ensifer sp. ZNC0028]